MPSSAANLRSALQPEPRFSILLSSRDEGDALRRTFDDLLEHPPQEPFEVVVVDDASGDGSTEFLRNAGELGAPVRFARNESRRGLAYSRARAADLARGRYLVFLDAHCTVSVRWLEALESELAGIEERGIVVPVMHDLSVAKWTIARESAPCSACTLIDPFLDFYWTEPLELDGHLSTCVIGGGAWMCSRDWYEHVGGLDRGMLAWGGENVDIALRTWVAGGWCVVAKDVLIGHLFKTRQIHPVSSVETAYNKIRAAHNVFSEQTFHEVMLRLRCLRGFPEALSRLHQDTAGLGRLKGHVESIRARSDRWLIDTFRLPIREPAFFYRVPRRTLEPGQHRRRPAVAVVVANRRPESDIEPLLGSLLEETTYGNCEVVLVSSTESSERSSRRHAERVELARRRYEGHPRFRSVSVSFPLGGGVAENLWALATDAEYCAFLDGSCRELDPHWIEKFLLLFERRTRLVLASPRLRACAAAASAQDAKCEQEDVFDVVWDWNVAGFSRERRGKPAADVPYQVLSCPGEALFVDRQRFVELGGFDPSVRSGGRPVLDLAVRAWLAGFEVFCHPGIVVERVPGASTRQDGLRSELREYAQVLAAAKCFTDPRRLASCRERSRGAETLLYARSSELKRRRREFLERARFDDNWLFYKFGMEPLP